MTTSPSAAKYFGIFATQELNSMMRTGTVADPAPGSPKVVVCFSLLMAVVVWLMS